MFKKVLKVSLLSLVLSLLPSSFQSVNAVDTLWNPGVSNDLSNAGTGLVPGAGIRNTGLLVNKSNPDELIMKIIMSDSFEDKPFSAKGRNMAMWIYWPKDYCWSKETANCEGLFTVGEPFNPSSYPSAKSSEYVFVQKHVKASNVDVNPTTCKAPWWIESTYKNRDTWSFAVSITCLGIPKEFGWYAFSQIDIGQKDVVSDFTSVQTIVYPFHELAASAAAKNSQTAPGLPLADENSKQVCVTGTGIDGYRDEQCTDSGNWAFQVCEANPKADLQILRNKKWVKLKTVNGVKNLVECPSDEKVTGYYFYRFTGGLVGDYRIKNYGSKKYSTGYIKLKVIKKDRT
jgi:hypothetical protein